MHPLSLSARCIVLDLVEEDDDDGGKGEDTRYSDAKYVKNNELAISDIIFLRYVCCSCCWMLGSSSGWKVDSWIWFEPCTEIKILLLMHLYRKTPSCEKHEKCQASRLKNQIILILLRAQKQHDNNNK
jgi:hypothetical protein